MSSSLDNAVAAFLDSVSERAFDEPLLALLRAEGYTNVVFSHGSREFGKDIFARKNGEQWAFQSKAGTIRQSDWERLEGQLRLLRVSDYAGPAFDPNLTRRAVLVTTGRLVGNVPLLVTEYNRQALARGEPELVTWERDELLGRMSGNPDSILRGAVDGFLLSILGEIEQGAATMSSLELFSRRWEEYSPERLIGEGIVEAALLCEGLARSERLDLACHLALCLVTRAWGCDQPEDGAIACADSAWRLFDAYAEQLWDRCDEQTLQTGALMGVGLTAWVTYPARCARVAELIAIYGLRLRQETDGEAKSQVEAQVGEWLSQFVYRQPGASHLISDRYAVSLVPPTLLLGSHKPRAAKRLLTRTTVWICDRHESTAFGLAGPYAEPIEEIERLMGVPFEHIPLRRKRRQSLAAAVCVDLAGICRYKSLYDDIRNDFLAVQLVPTVLRCASNQDQYRLTGTENRFELNPDYPETLSAEALSAMPHHRDDYGRHLLSLKRPMDLLAVSSALRDRYFCGAIQSLLAP